MLPQNHEAFIINTISHKHRGTQTGNWGGEGGSPGAGWQSLWGEGNSHGDLQEKILFVVARKKLINYKK